MSEESKRPEEMQEEEACQDVPEEDETEESTGGGSEGDAQAADETGDEAVDTEEPADAEDSEEEREEKKDKKSEQIEELTDRLQRNMAEFDNYRKRTEKEKASMYIIGAKEVIEKILPVVDNFERGLASAEEGDAFAEGMQMVYKQLMTTLTEMGVQPIEAVGQEFDPNLHNAVMHVEDPEAGENTVVEELQKGYTYKDFVVRHSMVKVAN